MKKASEILFSQNHQIIEEWEKRAKKEILASKNTEQLVLRNQLPHLLDGIADIMSRYKEFEHVKEDENYEEIINNSIDHGRHRATSSQYTVKHILEEYILFHRVITDVLRKNDCYTAEVGILLKYTLETAMLNSADSFNNSLQDMRQKLVGTLAHDMRNPISAALFAIDIMRYEHGEERFNKVKKMTERSLRKSIELMEGLLDAISVQAGDGITLNFDEIDLLKDIKWVRDEAQEVYDNKIELVAPDTEIKGVFDGTAIRRVLENLINNGVKYGSLDQPITVKVDEDESQVSLKVHNSGDSIPEEKQEKIFDFLNSSHDEKTGQHKSWGMGLTLVKIVAEAHGGNAKISSNEKDGTTFTITLEKFLNIPGRTTSKLNYVSMQ
ncbi:sensor histidine kinase [Zunongwangia endophytica]|uniref:histidine kinase n=1 Tax=Zunongwangia endophytica TaxID=1808945 RepID=A0ABV8H9G8_9FLAO|nr:HAMP domain-containing sensor histidine kinase [Zunongwangia endophytica]MDN3593549.1 HAMP domain-containing sensor histidine kinase [Zunongwangia endophytica]